MLLCFPAQTYLTWDRRTTFGEICACGRSQNGNHTSFLFFGHARHGVSIWCSLKFCYDLAHLRHPVVSSELCRSKQFQKNVNVFWHKSTICGHKFVFTAEPCWKWESCQLFNKIFDSCGKLTIGEYFTPSPLCTCPRVIPMWPEYVCVFRPSRHKVRRLFHISCQNHTVALKITAKTMEKDMLTKHGHQRHMFMV